MTTTTPSTPSIIAKDGLLRLTLRADAVISGVLGVVLGAAASRTSSLTGLPIAVEIALAAFFVVYGLTLFPLSRRPSVRKTGAWVIGGNVVYSALSVFVVSAGIWPLTTTGVVLTLGSGVYTLVMADLQYLGLRRLRG